MKSMNGENQETTEGIGRHLSMLAAWGLSFGFAVGWGAFVMPGASRQRLPHSCLLAFPSASSSRFRATTAGCRQLPIF